jgi:hypothetical protein
MARFSKADVLWMKTKVCPICRHRIIPGEWVIDTGWSAYSSVLQVRDIHLRCIAGFEELRQAMENQEV